MTSGRRWLPLSAVLLVAGCSIPLQRNRETVTSELARKRVIEKLAPDTLVAEDRTRCIPAESKYAQVARGDQVWCIWVLAPGTSRSMAGTP